MKPTDCVAQLWIRARHALEGDSLGRISSVFYRQQRSPTDPCAAEYDPSGPYIRIFRPLASVPKNDNEPGADCTITEACSLAHEYGHHLSKMAGARTPEYEAALLVFETWRQPPPGVIGRCPTRAEQALVIAEECLAWSNAYQVLKELGVTDWADFVEERETSLTNYRVIFQNMEKLSWAALPIAAP